MSKVKQLLGKKTWIGVLTALLVSLVLDGGGALLMSRGIISEMPAWVYASYAIGSFIGVRVAVRGESGTLLRAMIVCLILCVAISLTGVAAFGGISFRAHGLGVAVGLLSGCLCGGLIVNNKRKRKGAAKKRASSKR